MRAATNEADASKVASDIEMGHGVFRIVQARSSSPVTAGDELPTES